MNINLTLLGEIITFAILVWVTMKYIWPPIIKAMEERQKKIADGLEAAERGQNKLKVAEQETVQMLRDSKTEVAAIVDRAYRRANKLIDDAKFKGQEEGQRMVRNAEVEIEQMVQSCKESLRGDVANLIVSGAEKIMKQGVDKTSHDKMVDALIKEI